MGKEAIFKELIAEQRESRLTILEFCSNHGIAPSTFHYWKKKLSNTSVKVKLRKFSIISEVSDVTGLIIDKALASNFTDFEEAIQYHCSLAENCNILITSNGKDYKNPVIPVMSPDEYIASLNEL